MLPPFFLASSCFLEKSTNSVKEPEQQGSETPAPFAAQERLLSSTEFSNAVQVPTKGSIRFKIEGLPERISHQNGTLLVKITNISCDRNEYGNADVSNWFSFEWQSHQEAGKKYSILIIRTTRATSRMGCDQHKLTKTAHMVRFFYSKDETQGVTWEGYMRVVSKGPRIRKNWGEYFLGMKLTFCFIFLIFISEWPQTQEGQSGQVNTELQDLDLANYFLHVPVLGTGNGGGTSNNASELDLPKCGEGFSIVSSKRYNIVSWIQFRDGLDLNFSNRERELVRADGQSVQLLNVGMTPSKRSLALETGGRESYAKWPVRCKYLFFPLSFIVRRTGSVGADLITFESSSQTREDGAKITFVLWAISRR